MINFLSRLRGTSFAPRSERGDTIIEVLIATGIVSLVLTSAYALTNRNIQATQEVQEQAYAQKLVEQQVELLRASATKPASDGCFNASGVSVTGAACKVTNGGASYTLLVHPISAVQYSARATWETLGGKSANVTVYYRIAS